MVQRGMQAGKDHLANPRWPDSEPPPAPPATQRVIQLLSIATSPHLPHPQSLSQP